MNSIDIINWTSVVALSILMGMAYVRFLTVHPLRMGLYMFFSTIL